MLADGRCRHKTIRSNGLQSVGDGRASFKARGCPLGLAIDDTARDHVRCSLARLAVQRALISCHILTIKGREYPRCLPTSAA